MTRLVRLNEVQYAETEHQIAGLVAQGFELAPLPTETPKEDKPAKDGKAKGKKAEGGEKEKTPPEGKKTDEGGAEDNPSPEGDEQH